MGKKLRLKLSDLFDFGSLAKIFESLALSCFSFFFKLGLLVLVCFELASSLVDQVLSDLESVV